MRSLPPLRFEEGVAWFPFSPSTAEDLLLAFMQPHPSEGVERLQELLLADPAFAIWAWLCRGREVSTGPSYLDELAEDLYESGPCWWPETPEPLAEFILSPKAGEALARAGVRGQLAARLHAPSPQAATSDAFLAALLFDHPSWSREILREPTADLNNPAGSDTTCSWNRLLQVQDGPATQAAVEAEEMLDGEKTVPASLGFDARARGAAQRRFLRRWPSRLTTKDEQAYARWDLFRRFLAARTPRDVPPEKDIEQQKRLAMKAFAYGAGHELNNPLANISARSQLLLADEEDPERRRSLAVIQQQAHRAYEMIADMMLFAEPPVPQWEDVNPSQLMEGLAAEILPLAEAQGTEFTWTAELSLPNVQLDSTQWKVAMRALLKNALEALGNAGHVRWEVGLVPEAPQVREPSNDSLSRALYWTISDTGPGISAEERLRIFDPFYSGREAGRGLGFGLPKAAQIVRMHSGTIEVESLPGAGAVFRVTLPLKNR